jgi:hypothetical protein
LSSLNCREVALSLDIAELSMRCLGELLFFCPDLFLNLSKICGLIWDSRNELNSYTGLLQLKTPGVGNLSGIAGSPDQHKLNGRYT